MTAALCYIDQVLGLILNVMALRKYYLNLQWYSVHVYVCVGLKCSPNGFLHYWPISAILKAIKFQQISWDSQAEDPINNQ